MGLLDIFKRKEEPKIRKRNYAGARGVRDRDWETH